jgi:hypothetical protein
MLPTDSRLPSPTARLRCKLPPLRSVRRCTVVTRVKGFEDLPLREQLDFLAACFSVGANAMDLELTVIERSDVRGPCVIERHIFIADRRRDFAHAYAADPGIEWVSLFMFDYRNPHPPASVQ